MKFQQFQKVMYVYLTSKEKYTIAMAIIPVFLWLNVIYCIICQLEMSVTIPVTVLITIIAFVIWFITI